MNPLLNAPRTPPNPMTPPAGGMMMGPPQMAPQALPQGALQPPPPSPDQIDEARKHLGAIMGALSNVAAKPQGTLTKQDVFEAATDMLERGGFPTPASRADLIATLTKMPNDEAGLRNAIGRMMLRVSDVQSQFHQVHGAPPAPQRGMP